MNFQAEWLVVNSFLILWRHFSSARCLPFYVKIDNRTLLKNVRNSTPANKCSFYCKTFALNCQKHLVFKWCIKCSCNFGVDYYRPFINFLSPTSVLSCIERCLLWPLKKALEFYVRKLISCWNCISRIFVGFLGHFVFPLLFWRVTSLCHLNVTKVYFILVSMSVAWGDSFARLLSSPFW